MQPRILIFVSKTGGCHITMAEALRDQLTPHFSVVMVDPQPGLVHSHYRLVSRNALWLWELEYRFSDRADWSLAAHKTFTFLLEWRVAKVLKKFKPDLIMSTYPFLTYEIISTMRKLGLQVPFVMLQADPYGVHQSWLTARNADMVFCPTRETYNQTLKAGFSNEQVHLSGWPVREQFYHASQSAGDQILEKMGFKPDRFTVLLQGGGEGAANFWRTVENLLSVKGIQIILAIGTNKALSKRFQNTERLHILPFTPKIAPYMAAADVVMGKPGSGMVFESMTMGKPFIATSFIPGQEQLNLEFIKSHGLGWVVLDPRSQHSLIESLVSQPERLNDMKASVAAYNHWNSARVESIFPSVKGLLNN